MTSKFQTISQFQWVEILMQNSWKNFFNIHESKKKVLIAIFDSIFLSFAIFLVFDVELRTKL